MRKFRVVIIVAVVGFFLLWLLGRGAGPRRGVLRFEFDGASKRVDGFGRSPHFHQGASQSHPARLVVWVALEKLAESSHLASEDVWVVVGQLEKVTEVASARLAERWITYLAP